MLLYYSVSLGKSSPVLEASDTLILLFPKYWQLSLTKPAFCFLNINAFWRKLASGFCFVLLLQLPCIYITLLAASHSDLQVLTDSHLQGSWWETQYFGANGRNRDPERSSVAKRKRKTAEMDSLEPALRSAFSVHWLHTQWEAQHNPGITVSVSLLGSQFTRSKIPIC